MCKKNIQPSFLIKLNELPLFLLSDACFRGRQTGQSCRRQFFQCEIICLDEAQCATETKTQFYYLHNTN